MYAMSEVPAIEQADHFFQSWNAPAPDPVGAPSAHAAHARKLTDLAGTLWRTAASPKTSEPAAGGLLGRGLQRATSPPGPTPPTLSTAIQSAETVTAALFKPLDIEIGRTELTQREKWQLQAAWRRQKDKMQKEEGVALKSKLRPTKMTQGPSSTPGAAFPAGRGRPTS